MYFILYILKIPNSDYTIAFFQLQVHHSLYNKNPKLGLRNCFKIFVHFNFFFRYFLVVNLIGMSV